MKKVLFALTAFLGLGLAIVATGCGGGGGGGSDDDEVASTPSGSGGGSDEEDVASTPSGSSGSTSVSGGFVLVQNGTVTGGNQFTLTGQTADYYKGVFIAGRTVTISPFYICDHEVTQAEYQAVMGSNPSYFSGSRTPASGETQEKRPVEQVSWYDAITYCNKRSIAEGLTPCYTVSGVDFSGSVTVPPSNDATWNGATCNFSANGYRLPTEAEWEFAARGGVSGCSAENPTDYAGTENELSLGTYAWYYSNSDNKTHEVKKKEANALGLFDMSGNVWEWCWDWHETIGTGSITNPAGAASGSYRVYRGGSWNNSDVGCSVAFRLCSNAGLDQPPVIRDYRFGFRVVRTAD